ncbi:MAG: hypothetical protein KKH88_01050 [Nanoarchaeota archaeon]|nr:hypothetical protein [Nanoarchaeota archaeon]
MSIVQAVKDAQKDLRDIDTRNHLLRMVLISKGQMAMPDGSIFTPVGGEGLAFTSKLTERYSKRLDREVESDEALILYVQELNEIVANYLALRAV